MTTAGASITAEMSYHLKAVPDKEQQRKQNDLYIRLQEALLCYNT
jgi:hypothetical protein